MIDIIIRNTANTNKYIQLIIAIIYIAIIRDIIEVGADIRYSNNRLAQESVHFCIIDIVLPVHIFSK